MMRKNNNYIILDSNEVTLFKVFLFCGLIVFGTGLLLLWQLKAVTARTAAEIEREVEAIKVQNNAFREKLVLLCSKDAKPEGYVDVNGKPGEISSQTSLPPNVSSAGTTSGLGIQGGYPNISPSPAAEILKPKEKAGAGILNGFGKMDVLGNIWRPVFGFPAVLLIVMLFLGFRLYHLKPVSRP